MRNPANLTVDEDKFHSRDGGIAQQAAACCQIKWIMVQGGLTVMDRVY